jgi:hypothetical protein
MGLIQMQARTAAVGLTMFVPALLVLTGCATGAPRSIEFSSASPQALVIFGTMSDSPRKYDLTLSTYDAQNLRLTSNSFKGQYSATHDPASPSPIQYHVLAVPAGTYVVKALVIPKPIGGVDVMCLSKGTAQFELKAGEVTYIGNTAWRSGEVVRMGFDDDAAAAALKAYPNVRAAPARATLTDTTFRNGKDAFGMGEVCGGYYVDELPKS